MREINRPRNNFLIIWTYLMHVNRHICKTRDTLFISIRRWCGVFDNVLNFLRHSNQVERCYAIADSVRTSVRPSVLSPRKCRQEQTAVPRNSGCGGRTPSDEVSSPANFQPIRRRSRSSSLQGQRFESSTLVGSYVTICKVTRIFTVNISQTVTHGETFKTYNK